MIRQIGRHNCVAALGVKLLPSEEKALSVPRIESLSLTLTQCERLAYIDFWIYFVGGIGRPGLSGHFGLTPAAATRDLALYGEIAPRNIEFDGHSKVYRIAEGFSPVFVHPLPRVLSALSQGFGDSIMASFLPDLPCEIPASLSHPSIEVLASICRAFHAQYPVAIRYYSFGCGEAERIIVPSAQIDTGSRRHVRAFDRRTQEFRDFVITRIRTPQLLSAEKPKAHEVRCQNEQSTRLIDLELVSHPDQPHPETTEMDYGMQDGALRVRTRAAMAGYLLRKLSVDCSPDHSLRGHESRLLLKNFGILCGTKSAVVIVPRGVSSWSRGARNG